MKMKYWLVIGLFALCLSGLQGQEPDKDGFVPLMNSRDFTGWTGGKNGYRFVDGVLMADETVTGALWTRKAYTNFILRFDVRLYTNANNGVGIRFTPGSNPAYGGMEIQILDDAGPNHAKLKDWQYHGSIYGVVPARRGFQKPVGEWNTEEIRALGSKITVILNGEKILDVDVSTLRPPYPDGKDHPGLHNASGPIAWLGHKSRVDFRNIRIKEIQ